jgi:putative DNA primase/helicase
MDVNLSRDDEAIARFGPRANGGNRGHAFVDWPEPTPLPDGLPAVMPFDFALLPDSLAPWASDICDRMQCPPDFVGATIMTSLGSVIGRQVGIRPQASTDWTEIPNCWACNVGRPGILKSPAMQAALAPLHRLAALAAEHHESDIVEFKREAQIAKLRAAAAEKTVRATLGKNPKADITGILIDDDCEEPAMRRHIANDTSVEALGEILRANPKGILVYRDELVSLLKSLDREENAGARGFYLSGWNGTGGYTFDRIGRGLNLHISAVCLSLLGSTQPGRIAEYIRMAVKGGPGDDGLIQRFGLLVWPDPVTEWLDVDRRPHLESRATADTLFEQLDRVDLTRIGARSDQFGSVPYLRFDQEALELFREWRSRLEIRLRSGELHPAFESHLAKYRKLVPTLALIVHLADNGVGPVPKKPMLQALAWADYLESHAKRAYASVTIPEVAAAKALIARLRSADLHSPFAARDVYRKGWSHLSDREQVYEALRLLVDFDWLRVYGRDTEGRTATVYEANPKGLGQ